MSCLTSQRFEDEVTTKMVGQDESIDCGCGASMVSGLGSATASVPVRVAWETDAPRRTNTSSRVITKMPMTNAPPAMSGGVDSSLDPLDFVLPPELEAHEPPEARGIARDEVRLMVSSHGGRRIEHAQFRDIGAYLSAGDLVVVNTSATMNAALIVRRAECCSLEMHLSTQLGGALWVVELRRPDGASTVPYAKMRLGETLRMPGGGEATIHAAYPHAAGGDSRLWLATLQLPLPLQQYLSLYGFPIRYAYVDRAWPLACYQTVFAREGAADEAGSAEMPSAGRGFTPKVLDDLTARGVRFASIELHTGVSSLEEHEPPYAERYSVPAATAEAVNATRRTGRRVVAVGTTVVRALETATDESGVVRESRGWTELIVTPQRGVRVVDALLTGLHEPRASHLAMLETIAGRDHLELSYAAALSERYLWHEFGDLHLML